MAKKKAKLAPTGLFMLVDKSGSMNQVRKETIESFNSYVDSLRENKQMAKSVYLTLTQFDSNGSSPSYVGRPLNEVPHLTTQTYQPDGWTPLYDAIGKTIRAAEGWAALQTEKPRILFVIQTDGAENHSKEYTLADVKRLIKEKEADGWSFAYLGAGQEAWMGAGHLGMHGGNTVLYTNTAASINAVTSSLSASTVTYLSSNDTYSNSSASLFGTGVTNVTADGKIRGSNGPTRKS